MRASVSNWPAPVKTKQIQSAQFPGGLLLLPASRAGLCQIFGDVLSRFLDRRSQSRMARKLHILQRISKSLFRLPDSILRKHQLAANFQCADGKTVEGPGGVAQLFRVRI